MGSIYRRPDRGLGDESAGRDQQRPWQAKPRGKVCARSAQPAARLQCCEI